MQKHLHECAHAEQRSPREDEPFEVVMARQSRAGRTLGRCYDHRGDLTATKLRAGLHVGRKAWLAHLGAGSGGALSVVRWEAVVRIEGDRIVVRDDASDR